MVNSLATLIITTITGQLETTLLRGSIVNSNVRALLSDDHDIQPHVMDMISTMENIDNEDIRGFRLASILDPSSPQPTAKITGKPGTLTPEHFRLFQEHENLSSRPLPVSDDVMFYDQIALQGVCYGVAGSRTYRNSAVLFTTDGSIYHNTASAGIINAIFSTSNNRQDQNFWLVVSELRPFTSSSTLEYNPFHRYGFAGGRLYLTSDPIQRVIHLPSIISHMVLTPMDREPFLQLYHGLAVDRVRSFFLVVAKEAHIPAQLMHIFTTFNADEDVNMEQH